MVVRVPALPLGSLIEIELLAENKEETTVNLSTTQKFHTNLQAYLDSTDTTLNKYGEIFFNVKHTNQMMKTQGKQPACVVPVLEIVDIHNPEKEIAVCERVY